MQGRAGSFDLGLFGGETHGLSLHSTGLSSIPHVEAEKDFNNDSSF